MIMLGDVVDRIRRVAKGSLDEFDLTESNSLTEFGLSSLQVSDLIFTLEVDLDLEFDAEQAADVDKLGELIALVYGA